MGGFRRFKEARSHTDIDEMQGLRRSLRAHGLRNLLNDQGGWVLMDAVWSSLVVVLAFVATTMAFEGSNRSVTRDANKTQALVVAQNEIESMRSVAQSDISKLTATPANGGYNGKVSTVTVRGITYTVTDTAYYVTGLGSDTVDACGNAYSANGSAARYIYMKTKVTYAGQLVGKASNGTYAQTPAMLDAYYAPEGGANQSNTGTLRVYILDRNDNLISSPNTITLYQGTSTTAYDTENVNPTTGCALFTGLPRATYYMKVQVTAGQQDLYLSRNTSNIITQKVSMPYRGALTRVMRIDQPNTVSVSFKTLGGTDGVTPVDVSTDNAISSTFVGPWVAQNDEILADPNTDFATGPGRTYMPHTIAQSDALFPTKDGYQAYAGACNLNDPSDGNTANGTEWTPIPDPSELNGAAWLPGANYTSPILWLSQMRTKIGVTAGANPNPTSTNKLAANTRYYYGQTLSAGYVAVRLTGDQNGRGIYADCGPRKAALYNKWVKLPGAVNLTTGNLDDQAEALPTGTYDVCIKATMTSTSQQTNSTGTGWAAGTLNTGAVISWYVSQTGKLLKYKDHVDPLFQLNNPQGNSGAATDCGSVI